MDDYDEDLTANEFFIEFKKRCPTIYATLPKRKWILCIPKSGSVDSSYFNDISFFSHVIVPLEKDDEGDDATLLKTLRNQQLFIEKKTIRTGAGFRKTKKVPILFDETFFDEAGHSHVLYCIGEPLERAYSPEDEVEVEDDEREAEEEDEVDDDDSSHSLGEGHVVALNTVEDCKLLLWGHSDHWRLQNQMDAQIEAFARLLAPEPGGACDLDVENCVADLRGLHQRCLALASKDPFLAQAAGSNPGLQEAIAAAVETYCLDALHLALWPRLADLCARDDAALNRQVRRLSRRPSHSLGVPREFIDRVPRARREFAQVERLTSPRSKNLCLRRVARHLAHVSAPAEDRNARRQSVLTSDELLPILVFLIVKSQVRNWYAQLTYMRQFRLVTDGADEFSYYCTSLEAAMTHIRASLASEELGREEEVGLRLVRSESSPTPHSVDAFLQLVDSGDVASVSSILSRSTPETSALPVRQCHPLCRCAECEKASAERSRLVGVHCYNEHGRTPLHVACLRGHAQMVDLLISHGATVNVVDGQGWTGLHLACLAGHQDVVLLLLDAKADINAPDNEGNAPLHLCAERDFKDCVKALVYHGGNKSVLNVDATNIAGDTALHLSARYGYEELCVILLDCMASILVKNRRGQRSPDCALSPRMRQLLLRRLALPTEIATEAISPSSNMVESGIELAPSSSNTITSARTPTVSSSGVAGSTVAGASRSTSRSSGFIDGPLSANLHGSVVGSQTDSANPEVSSVVRRVEKMLKAAGDGDLQMVRHYLGLQDDDENEELQPNGVGTEAALCHPLCQCDKCLPIQKPCHSSGTLRTLSAHCTEVHVNSANADGFTCLHVAAIHGHSPLAHFLLRRGADPGRRTRNLRLCALHQAAQYGWPELVSLLVAFGSDPNAQDAAGNSSLYYAASNGRAVCTERLLAAGAKPHIANARGNAPLHEAARAGHTQIVQLLLKHGARPQVRNKHNLTPLQFCTTDEVRQLLEAAAQMGSTSSYGSPGPNATKRRSSDFVWSSERQPPASLNLFETEEAEVAEEVFAHRPLFDDEDGAPTVAAPSINSATPQPPEWTTSESESSPYRAAMVDSLTSTTPENAYRLDFNSLESSPDNKESRRK